jgi:hypothetical protein
MKTYFFTFGGFNEPQFHNTCAMVIAENSFKARELMCKHFDSKWAFQYDHLESVHENDRKISVVIIADCDDALMFIHKAKMLVAM